MAGKRALRLSRISDGAEWSGQYWRKLAESPRSGLPPLAALHWTDKKRQEATFVQSRYGRAEIYWTGGATRVYGFGTQQLRGNVIMLNLDHPRLIQFHKLPAPEYEYGLFIWYMLKHFDQCCVEFEAAAMLFERSDRYMRRLLAGKKPSECAEAWREHQDEVGAREESRFQAGLSR